MGPLMQYRKAWLYSIRIFLAFAITFFSFQISAATMSNLPSKNEIKTELNSLNKKNNAGQEDKLAIADLEKSLNYYDELEKLDQRSDELQKKLSHSGEELKKAVQGLLQIKNQNENPDINFQHQIENSSLQQLESMLATHLDNLQAEQNDLATYNSQLIGLQTQPERAQAIMLDNARRLQEIRNELNSTLTDSSKLRTTQVNMLQLEQYLLQQQNEFQKRVLQANTQLQDVLQKQRDYTAAYIEQLDARIQVIQDAISKVRLSDSQSTVREAQNTSTDDAVQQNPIIQKEVEINNKLSNRLIEVTQDGNKMVQNGIRVKTWLERATQSERNLKEQINVLRGSLLLSRILFQQQIDLPADILTKNLPVTIADLRLEQFDINQQRDALYQPTDYINNLEHEQAVKVGEQENTRLFTPEDKAALVKILDVRRELLDELNLQLGGQISQAINLQLDQNQLLSVVSSLEHTLAQQIFWVNSNKPMDIEWLKAFPEAAKNQLTHLDFDFSLSSLKKGLLSSLWVTIPLLLAALIFIWLNRKITQRLHDIDLRLSSLRNDSVLNTPLALLLTLLQTIPTSLVVIAIGYWFLKTGNLQGEFIWSYFLQLAIFWALFELTFRVLKPQGIAEKHFNIEHENAQRMRRRMVRLSVPLIPLIFFSTYGMINPLKVSEDVIGQLVVSICLLLLCIFTIPFCKQVWKETGSHLTRSILITLLTFSPLILIGLMIAGYYYTTLRLANRWLDSLYLLVLWYITYNVCLRGLSLGARKLAYKRALERRAQSKQQEETENEPIKEPPMTIELISQQSLRLMTMVLFIIFAFAFYAIWSDFITIFSFLDSVQLWSYTATSAEGANIMQHVTLANLILAVVIVVVAWIMTRNLPGLLEVLVLSRLKLRQGFTYAITTMLTYVIVSIGAIASLGMIGVTWNQLQWLAAALTVGLGFGLQEIFANFVSGIILLFERPIRIGDTVTIGTYSGTISKIRIRATTIVDFDRKEVIIPNKAFVTERLINWSLSDTVTRITVSLGVAYGSDLEKVKRVLLQAATSNSKVMTDPAPAAYFLSFGASTLDHELRFYVRQIGERTITSDEVNREIDRLCRENDINIAFNQLEVHLHNNQGDEVQEVTKIIKDKDNDKNGDEK
ncbi:mechanosensitive channel MscK [Providencia sp. wls1943]|uniref:mechanosensitive channel MscK n=1 Tax=Providencia sp. wls1943 TaxID=2675150 RepID=UPI0012B52740|nr:mechanosensitive channel MscK [Providencia sp. wls1943]